MFSSVRKLLKLLAPKVVGKAKTSFRDSTRLWWSQMLSRGQSGPWLQWLQVRWGNSGDTVLESLGFGG